ncbi:hypothetical protein MTO96_025153 [Rhipicephalus appendiculatus]
MESGDRAPAAWSPRGRPPRLNATIGKKQATSRFQLLHVVTVHAVGRRPLRSAGSQVEVDYELVPIHQDCSMGTTLFDLMTAAMSAVHY